MTINCLHTCKQKKHLIVARSHPLHILWMLTGCMTCLFKTLACRGLGDMHSSKECSFTHRSIHLSIFITRFFLSKLQRAMFTYLITEIILIVFIVFQLFFCHLIPYLWLLLYSISLASSCMSQRPDSFSAIYLLYFLRSAIKDKHY